MRKNIDNLPDLRQRKRITFDIYGLQGDSFCCRQHYASSFCSFSAKLWPIIGLSFFIDDPQDIQRTFCLVAWFFCSPSFVVVPWIYCLTTESHFHSSATALSPSFSTTCGSSEGLLSRVSHRIEMFYDNSDLAVSHPDVLRIGRHEMNLSSLQLCIVPLLVHLFPFHLMSIDFPNAFWLKEHLQPVIGVGRDPPCWRFLKRTTGYPRYFKYQFDGQRTQRSWLLADDKLTKLESNNEDESHCDDTDN